MRWLLICILFIFAVAEASAQERHDPAGAPVVESGRVAPSITTHTPPSHDNSNAALQERFEKSPLRIPQNLPEMTATPERQIVLLGAMEMRAQIYNNLRARNIEIIEEYDLKALESVLIVTKGSPALLQDLRRALQEVEIDWNDDLSPAKGPRLYAKEKIKWPDKGACLDKALKTPIGLIDGSIERSHPAFAGQNILEESFLEGHRADKNHATAIASILIGNAPEEGFDGLLTGAKLYNAVVLRSAPNERNLASIVATLRALDWLLDNNIRLINVSLAGKKNRVMERAFKTSLERGALIFAAAGNNGPNAPPSYPATIDGVFAITAIDAAGRLYKQANQGDYIDFAAPGVDIWAATSTGRGAYLSGTSYAVPYALASSTLYLSINPALPAALLSKLLKAKGKYLVASCPAKE